MDIFITDTFIKWSDKSKEILFKTNKKCIGNGEEKLAKELNIDKLGGQNNIYDLIHPVLGKISVKDMTNGDCTLGIERTQIMRKIFREVLNPFLNWIKKYKKKNCILAKEYYDVINKKYGTSRITIKNGMNISLPKNDYYLFRYLKKYNNKKNNRQFYEELLKSLG